MPMQPPKKKKKILRPKDFTELDWFFIEVFCKMILGKQHEVDRAKYINEKNKKPQQ